MNDNERAGFNALAISVQAVRFTAIALLKHSPAARSELEKMLEALPIAALPTTLSDQHAEALELSLRDLLAKSSPPSAD